MKHFLTFCLLVYLTPIHAQETSHIDIAKLLKTQRFAFVATGIKNKPGTNGSSGYNFESNYYSGPVASTTSIQQSLAYTSANVGGAGSAYSEMYYRSAGGDGSYFTAYGIPVAKGAKISEIKSIHEVMYFQHNESNLVMSELDNPKSISDINGNLYEIIPPKNIKTKISNKKNGSAVITYKIKEKGETKTFYLNVQKDGKAILQTPSTEDVSTYIHGYIINTHQ